MHVVLRITYTQFLGLLNLIAYNKLCQINIEKIISIMIDI